MSLHAAATATAVCAYPPTDRVDAHALSAYIQIYASYQRELYSFTLLCGCQVSDAERSSSAVLCSCNAAM